MTELLTSDKTWEKDGLCLKIPDWVLPDYSPEDYADRQQVCMDCPVIEQCRQWADRFEKPGIRHAYDVYGGETPEERVARRAPVSVRETEPCRLARERTVAMHQNRNEPLCSTCRPYNERRIADQKRWAHARSLLAKGYTVRQIRELAGVSGDKLVRLRAEMQSDSVSP